MPTGVYKRTIPPWNKGIKSPYTIWNKGKTKEDYPQLGNSGVRKGYKQTKEHIVNMLIEKAGKTNKGKHWKCKDISNMKGKTGDKNPCWKGDEVGYYALHHWVIKNLGRSKKCEHCGKKSSLNKNGRNTIHWANKSHNYKRSLTDWISLCVNCHKKYDKNHRRRQS